MAINILFVGLVLVFYRPARVFNNSTLMVSEILE